MRLKNRYVLLELRWKDGKLDEGMQESAIQSAFRDSIGVNFGDYGVAVSSGALQVKYYNPLTGMCMVRCGRDQLQEVLASIATITSVKYRTVLCKRVHNGGTLASCQRAAIAHDKAVLQQLRLSKAQTRLAAEAEHRLQTLGL